MITVKNLFYQYPGSDVETLKGIDFQVEAGTIYGFLGPSGAGKSTTQKILLGLLTGYRGEITIAEKPLKEWGNSYYETIGAAFEFPSFYSKFTARENLQFFGGLYQKKCRDIETLLRETGLEEDGDKKAGAFSKGMKIRLNLCRALLHDPKILFLDEPTSGLDPVNAKRIREVIQREKESGKAIFLTTHHMETAAELCDQVSFITDGKLSLTDSPRNLKLRYGEPILRMEYRNNGSITSRDFPVSGIGKNKTFLELLESGQMETLHSREASLDDVFIQATGRSLT